MTLEQLFEHGAAFARSAFERSGEVLPMWIGETATGIKVPIVAPMIDKDRLVESLKELFTKAEVVQCVSLLEAWTLKESVAKGKNQEEAIAEAYKYGSISEHPDREEVIWIHAEDKDGAEITGALWIKRDKSGKATLSDLERMPNTQSSEGRFVNLLGGNRTTVQ